MWIEVEKEHYEYALNVLPPAIMLAKGFLVGEPTIYRICRATGDVRPAYPALVEYGGKFYENTEAMTVPEFVAFEPSRDL